MLLRKLKETKAFTLIELLVVIVILFILTFVAVPAIITVVGVFDGGDSSQVEVIDQEEEYILKAPSDNGTSDKGENKQL